MKNNKMKSRVSRSMTKSKKQCGGTYLPAEYHGGDSGRYTASPSGPATGAYGAQVPVSHGVIHDGVAGPNLAWSGGNMMTGGSSRCRTAKKNNRRKKPSKRTQKAGGCGCNTNKFTN